MSLDSILGDTPPAFALIYRPTHSGDGVVDVLCGQATTHCELADIPTGGDQGTLVLLPFRQIIERGFTVVNDDADLIAIQVGQHVTVDLRELLGRLPDEQVCVDDGRYESETDTYVKQVREIIEQEIGRGEGSNFVIKRSFTGQIANYGLRTALTLFRRLLETETGAYWTFIVSTGDRVLVGASPERQISCTNRLAVMNPISGTYRYPPTGPEIDGLLEFLADTKEIDELNMVVDEELKMMSRICDGGAWAAGPYLREMAHLAHTEYYVQGYTSRPALDLLRESMFAPTVVGSPLENAFRVIARREGSGRRYYSGCIALIAQDAQGAETLDSAIIIRTAEIDNKGRIALSVGATLVRSSSPQAEVAELESKVASLLNILVEHARPKKPHGGVRHALASRPAVADGLAQRNSWLAPFWFLPDNERRLLGSSFDGRKALILDGEDTFTSMLSYQLDSLGLQVTVRDVRDDAVDSAVLQKHDLVVLGPGPGDPRDLTDNKIARVHRLLRLTRDAGMPMLAVCLGHQVLCLNLGLQIVRLEATHQGTQREIDLFGTAHRVGFYNTFVGIAEFDQLHVDGMDVTVSRDPVTGHVHALRATGMRSLQFHPESILTYAGIDILRDCLNSLLPAQTKGGSRC